MKPLSLSRCCDFDQPLGLTHESASKGKFLFFPKSSIKNLTQFTYVQRPSNRYNFFSLFHFNLNDIRGFFPCTRMNANYGFVYRTAVLINFINDYRLSVCIIDSKNEPLKPRYHRYQYRYQSSTFNQN